MPIMTCGEVFTDGSAVELVRNAAEAERANLLFWNGAKETIAPVVERNGRRYKPVPVEPSIFHELILPDHVSPHGSTREILSDLSKLAVQIAGLSEKSAAVVGRVILASWIIRALPVAPELWITGPDRDRGNRLIQLLRYTCRHALPMSGVTGSALRSLPSGVEFTLLINQPNLSEQVMNLLDVAGRRDQKILARGALLDLYGVQVLHSESAAGSGSWSFRSIRLPMIPANDQLPAFDVNVQQRIGADLQPKLLSYRLAEFGSAAISRFDPSRFTHSLRELAGSLAATTPDDAPSQAELLELLKAEDSDLRSAKWTAFATVAIETMIVACRERSGGHFYVGELSEIAQEIWQRRGVYAVVDPGAFGKGLRDLGFETGPRDAKGVKVQLNDAICARTQQLARDFAVPEASGEGEA